VGSKIKTVIDLLNDKNFSEAKIILEEILSSDPKNAEVLYNLGMCYSELGELDNSVETLKQSLKFKPDNPNALTALGFSYIKLDRYKEAEEALKRALELDPNNLFAINNLGGLYGKMEKYELAIKTFDHGEKLFPDDSRIIYGLGISYQKLGNLATADAYFRKLVKRVISDEYTELGKTGLREIAQEELKKRGLRPDAVMYCLAALQRFSRMNKTQIQKIAFEIALQGRSGFDTNDPSPKYQLISLPGNYSGLNLVCSMYVGFKIIAPDQDIGFDLSKEYEEAKNILDKPDLIIWN
jgi:tetratricopeptide (TPR) repeat protein